ncbi:Gag-Pol polyprotein [Plecturocebus cupreus]
MSHSTRAGGLAEGSLGFPAPIRKKPMSGLMGLGLLIVKHPGAQVYFKDWGKPISFLVNGRVAHSVLTQPLGPLSSRKTVIQGTTGKTMTSLWTTNRVVDLGNGTITHSFLVLPECPYLLLGQDLLHKLRATISFCENQACLSIPRLPSTSKAPQQILITCALSDEYLLQEALSLETNQASMSDLLCQFQESVPRVWAETNPPGLAEHHTPVVVQLLAMAALVQVWQYPMTQEARQGIAPHITRLLEGGILTLHKSPWNTPLLPVLKPGTKVLPASTGLKGSK